MGAEGVGRGGGGGRGGKAEVRRGYNSLSLDGLSMSNSIQQPRIGEC